MGAEQQARETLDAIRLALEGGADDKAQLAVIRTLIADGPSMDKKGTASVRRFLRAVKRVRGRLEVVR